MKEAIEHFSPLIKEAFKEDLPDGDITTDSLGVKEKKGKARLVAKEDLVLSGCSLFEACILHQDSETKFRWLFQNGEQVLKDQNVCVLQGNLVQFLKAERVALNALSHLCGISTWTRKFVKAIEEESSCEILDTRKTLPMWRKLEKQAVLDGGGQNHRFHLSERVLIKENHLTLIGGKH